MGKAKKRQLKPIREYLNDKGELIEQMFASIPIVEVKNMVPINLQGMPLHELKAECLVELLAMSNGEILSILSGKKRKSVSSSESEESLLVLSDEEDRFQKKEERHETKRKERTDHSLPEPSRRDKKKKQRKGEEIELKNKKKKKGDAKDTSLPSTSKTVAPIKQSPNTKKKRAEKVNKDKIKEKREKEPVKPVDDVVIIDDDEIQESAAKKEEKSLLDLLELEMRARAIKALLKTEDDKEKRKRLEEYRDEPDDLIPIVEETPQIELLSDSDDESANKRREIAKNVQIQLHGDKLSSHDVEVLDTLLGITGKEKVDLVESIVISDDASSDSLDTKSLSETRNQSGEGDWIMATVKGDDGMLRIDKTGETIESGEKKAVDKGEIRHSGLKTIELVIQDTTEHPTVAQIVQDSLLSRPTSQLGACQNDDSSRKSKTPRVDPILSSKSIVDGPEKHAEKGQLASDRDGSLIADILTLETDDELLNMTEPQFDLDRAHVGKSNFLVKGSNESRGITTNVSIMKNIKVSVQISKHEKLSDYKPSLNNQTPTSADAESNSSTHHRTISKPTPISGSSRDTINPESVNALVEKVMDTDCGENTLQRVRMKLGQGFDMNFHELDDNPISATNGMSSSQHNNIENTKLVDQCEDLASVHISNSIKEDDKDELQNRNQNAEEQSENPDFLVHNVVGDERKHVTPEKPSEKLKATDVLECQLGKDDCLLSRDLSITKFITKAKQAQNALPFNDSKWTEAASDDKKLSQNEISNESLNEHWSIETPTHCNAGDDEGSLGLHECKGDYSNSNYGVVLVQKCSSFDTKQDDSFNIEDASTKNSLQREADSVLELSTVGLVTSEEPRFMDDLSLSEYEAKQEEAKCDQRLRNDSGHTTQTRGKCSIEILEPKTQKGDKETEMLKDGGDPSFLHENQKTSSVISHIPPLVEPFNEIDKCIEHHREEIIAISSPLSSTSSSNDYQEDVISVESDSPTGESGEENAEINSGESERRSPSMPASLETITIEDDDVVNTLVQQVPIEILQLDDSDNESTSWTGRWLESDNVKKVVKTSKMMMNLKKKLMGLKKSKMLQKVELPKINPSGDGATKLIGSVEEYHRLVKNNVILPSKACTEELKSCLKTGEEMESCSEVPVSEMASISENKELCLDQSKIHKSESKAGECCSQVDEPQATKACPDSGLEDISDIEEKEDGELSNSDEEVLDDQEHISNSILCTTEPLLPDAGKEPNETEICRSKIIEPSTGNVKKFQNSVKQQLRKGTKKVHKSPRPCKGAQLPPGKYRGNKKKKKKLNYCPGLAGSSAGNNTTPTQDSAAVTGISVNPGDYPQFPEVSNVIGGDACVAASPVPQMDFSNQHTMPSAYQAWLHQQGNYGYGTPEAAAEDPNVYKQWEEYYRSMMEACRASAAQVSANKGYDWVFDPSKLRTPAPQPALANQSAPTVSMIPAENTPTPLTQDGEYQYRYGLKGLLNEHFVESKY